MRIVHAHRKQRGAVLIVSLIMLAVMTLFVISMMKTSVIELKIGGFSQVAALNFANAEAAVNKFIVDNNGRFAPGFLTIAEGSGGAINTPPDDLMFGSLVEITPTQLNCGAWGAFGSMMGGSNLQAVQFDLRATASDPVFGGSTTLHQGVQTLAAAGSC